MNLNDIVLRKEKKSDYRLVEELTREAFWNLYEPGCSEHYLLHVMRRKESFLSELDIVAEINGRIVGNIVYTKAKIISDVGIHHEVISFGPISVLPEYQGFGIGSLLIEHTRHIAKDLGFKAILIYGDPDFYSRLGFVPAENYNIGTADNMYKVALQALELYPGALLGVSGCFNEDEVYNIDQKLAKEFNKSFVPKEYTKGLPTQLKFNEIVKKTKPRL